VRLAARYSAASAAGSASFTVSVRISAPQINAKNAALRLDHVEGDALKLGEVGC